MDADFLQPLNIIVLIHNVMLFGSLFGVEATYKLKTEGLIYQLSLNLSIYGKSTTK